MFWSTYCFCFQWPSIPYLLNNIETCHFFWVEHSYIFVKFSSVVTILFNPSTQLPFCQNILLELMINNITTSMASGRICCTLFRIWLRLFGCCISTVKKLGIEMKRCIWNMIWQRLFNPWSTNPAKWKHSNNLSAICWQNVWVCLIILWDWRLKSSLLFT